MEDPWIIIDILTSNVSPLQNDVVQKFINDQSSTGLRLSSDESWAKVQLLGLCVHQLGNEVSSNENDISVQKRKTLATGFDFIVGYGIRHNLLPNVYKSTQESCSTDIKQSWLQYRRLVATVKALEILIDKPKSPITIVFYESHLLHLVIAYLQLCYAPIKKSGVKPCSQTICHSDSLQDILNYGCSVDTEVNSEAIISEMIADRIYFFKKYEILSRTIYQPIFIRTLLEILSSSKSSPKWLRQSCSSTLSQSLLRDNGLANMLLAISEFMTYSDWRQIDALASLLVATPSAINEEFYLSNIIGQLFKIVQSVSDEKHLRVISSFCNSLLSTKTDMAAKLFFDIVFWKEIRLLKDITQDGSDQHSVFYSSKDLETHINVTSKLLHNSPPQSLLPEFFSVFFPLYSFILSAPSCQVSSQRTLLKHLTVSIIERLDPMVGLRLFLSSYDVSSNLLPRVSRALKPQVGDNGDIELVIERGSRQEDMEHPIMAHMLQNIDMAVKSLLDICELRPSFKRKLFLALLYTLNALEKSSENMIGFPLLVTSLVDVLSKEVQETIMEDVDDALDFTVQRLRTRIRDRHLIQDDEDFMCVLGLLESFTANSSQLSHAALVKLRRCASLLNDVEGSLEDKCSLLAAQIMNSKEVKQLSDDSEAQEGLQSALKILPVIMQKVFNVTWHTEDVEIKDEIEEQPSLEEIIAKSLNRNKLQRKSVYGTMSNYKDVKCDLYSADVAVRGHAFIQLRKLLEARDKETLQDLPTLAELCLQAMHESDSYVYLGAVQCFSVVILIDTKTYLDTLVKELQHFTKCLTTPENQGGPSSETSADSDIKGEEETSADMRIAALLCETLSRAIPSFGDMSPIYGKSLLDILCNFCKHNHEMLRLFGVSLIGRVVGQLGNVSSFLRQIVNICVMLLISDESEMVQYAAVDGLKELLKGVSVCTWISDYPDVLRDLQRIALVTLKKTEDERLKLALQEVLLALGDIAKNILATRPQT